MSHIGFDLRALQHGYKAHKARGIGVYARNMIERSGLAPSGLEIIPFHDPQYESEEPDSHGSSPYEYSADNLARKISGEYFWLHLCFAKVIKSSAGKAGVGAFFFPTHLDVPINLGVPYAVTAHDMINTVFCEPGKQSISRKMDNARQVHVLKNAHLILAGSVCAKDDIIRCANVDPEKIVVTYYGVDPRFKPGVQSSSGRFELPDKYILHVGGIDWRKNSGLLLDAFARLNKARPEYQLVMAGDIKNDSRYDDFKNDLAKRSLEPVVHTPGYVTTEELILIYNKAALLLYPSLYEGFGLPVLEAMSCGTPVITTNRSSIPEVAGDAAILLDPDKPESFAEALIRLTGSENERKRLSEAGLRQADKFSWDRCAKETYEALWASFQ